MRLGIALLLLSPMIGVAQSPLIYPVQLDRIDSLATARESQLMYYFEHAQVGAIPQGYTPGLAILQPGGKHSLASSRWIRSTAWQGKYFDEPGVMTNRTFGVKSIQSSVEQGIAWHDGKPAIILDYADKSNIAREYRDEIREISSGIYLGIMFKRQEPRPARVAWFALDARTGQTCVNCRKD